MLTPKVTNGAKINPNKGEKEAIERLVKAYGFSTRQALCDHLGVSKSALAKRYMRDTFPSDWVIQCALETVLSVNWLGFGIGDIVEKAISEVFKLPKFRLNQGILGEAGECVWDDGYISFKRDFAYLVVDEKNYISVIHSSKKWKMVNRY